MWYSAKLLFESSLPDRENGVLQEESIRLIEATDKLEAIKKAKALGTAEQHEYANSDGEIVSWRFVSVVEVQDLSEQHLFDGMEVFSVMKWKRIAPDVQRAGGLPELV